MDKHPRLSLREKIGYQESSLSAHTQTIITLYDFHVQVQGFESAAILLVLFARHMARRPRQQDRKKAVACGRISLISRDYKHLNSAETQLRTFWSQFVVGILFHLYAWLCKSLVRNGKKKSKNVPNDHDSINRSIKWGELISKTFLCKKSNYCKSLRVTTLVSFRVDNLWAWLLSGSKNLYIYKVGLTEFFSRNKSK